jgi:hypothetical protein
MARKEIQFGSTHGPTGSLCCFATGRRSPARRSYGVVRNADGMATRLARHRGVVIASAIKIRTYRLLEHRVGCQARHIVRVEHHVAA